MSVPRRPRGAGALAASCTECFAWGVLPSRRCVACRSFRQQHSDDGQCTGCGRLVPLKNDYCRLCLCQASAEAKGAWTPTLLPYLVRVRHHQLFFAKMQRQKARKGQPRIGKRRRLPRSSRAEPATAPPVTGWLQPPLFEIRRDFTRFDRRLHADLANPSLVDARRAARNLGEVHGWTPSVTADVDRALVILLSGHVIGEAIRHSEVAGALRPRGLSVGRTITVLDHIGLLDDDRTSTFDAWLSATPSPVWLRS